MQKSNIDIIPSHKIDKTKWDNCVDQSTNGLIYANSFFLDAMSDNWHALIINDYEIIMPLPWRKKYGLKYIATPNFIQQLGLIYRDANDLTDNTMFDRMLKAISKHFRFIDYDFNFLNNNIKGASRVNYILDLKKSYEIIYNNYRKDLKQILKKHESNVLIEQTNDFAKAVNLYEQCYGDRMKAASHEHFEKFTALCVAYATQGNAMMFESYDNNKQLLSTAIFLKDNKRVYKLMSATPEAGRKSGANHCIIDHVIKQYAGENLLFDFCGSDIPSIKEFIIKFNPTAEYYTHTIINQLPWPLRLLKQKSSV